MRDITLLVLLLVPLGSVANAPPQDLTLVTRTCHSITFQWSPPGDTGRLDVTGYDILHNGTSVANITGTVYTLEGLTPDTVHTISVRTWNANGPSVLAGTLTNSTTQRDSVQEKVTADSVSSDSLTLSHSETQTTYRCLLSVERLHSVTVNVTSGTVTVHTQPDTAYNITCLGYDNQGRDLCREQNMSIITPPPAVVGVMFGNNTVKNGSIHQEIKWNVQVLRYNAKPQYLVKYAADSSRVLSASKFEHSSEPNTTLQLSFGTSNITYYVQVAARRTGEQDTGVGDYSDLVSITYTTPGPPQDLTFVNRTCHSITFQWSPPDDTGRLDVTGYDILHNGTQVANITGTVYTLEGLTPDTVHTISVRTRNDIGPSELEGTLTRASEGRDHQEIRAVTVSSHNLTLSHREAQVTYRCLLSAQGLKPVSVNVTSGETVTVTVLPDTMYTIGCVGYGEQGQKLCVEGNTTITTRPPKVENVTFGRTRVVSNMIWQDISWSTVQLQNDVTSYLIKSDTSPKMALRTSFSNTSSYMLKLKVPTSNTTFTVRVAAIRNRAVRDHGDFSDPQSITYTTPGPPDFKRVSRTCHSITFQWSPPDDTGRLDVTGYDILHNGTSVANITGTVYTLEGLTPDTVHTISMRTRNAIGPSVLERTLTTATTQRDSGQRKRVTADSETSHNLTLSHSEVQTTYRCLLSAEGLESVSVNVTSGTVTVDTHPDTAYNMTCVGYDNQGRDLCREQKMSIITRPPKVEGVMFGNNVVKNGRIHQEVKWNAPVLRHNEFPEYIIQYADRRRNRSKQSSVSNTTLELTFSTTYYIAVAVRSAGDQKRGDFSDPVSITYTTPGPPQSLTTVNKACHSITFQWSPPDDTGRLDVTGYDILHNGTPVATITGTVYTLEGLTPDTVHTISVRTRNAIGPSVLDRTLIRATGGRDKPLMVTAETTSSSSIDVGVSPPKFQTGRRHYKCNLTTEGSVSVSMLSLNDTRNNSPYIAVKGLSPYTNYTATCLVFKDGVDQCYIGRNTTQTYTDTPSVPVTDIIVTRVNDTAVSVTWTALTLNEARGFPSYVVSIIRRCEQLPPQTTNSTSVVVGGLMPHTEYNVTVQVLTAGGTKEGPLGEPVTLQKIPFVQPEPTHEQSATAATIGGFVGGTVFGVLVTLLVGGIVMGAVRIAKKEAGRRKHSAAVDASTCLAPNAIPMDANPSYEEVHVYEHIDKKDSKQ